MILMTATIPYHEPINPLAELVSLELACIRARHQLSRRFHVPRLTFFSLLERAYDLVERSPILALLGRLSGDRWTLLERAASAALFSTGVVLLHGLTRGELPELRSMQIVYPELYGWAFAMMLFGGAHFLSTLLQRPLPLRNFLGFSVTMIYFALCFAFGIGGAPTQFIWPPLGTLTVVAASAFVARVASGNADRPSE